MPGINEGPAHPQINMPAFYFQSAYREEKFVDFIGIDLGATEIKAGIVSEEGQIIDKTSVHTPVEDGIHAIVDSVGTLADGFLKTYDKTAQSIGGIGVGIPGVCSDRGLVYYAPNLFWHNVPLGSLLREKTGMPVFIENDATMAIVGEAACGVARGVSNCVLITLGTGIGSGIIINSNVYSGNHGIGSEIGHMIVGENFYDCNCGNNGCLETFASATALIKHTEKLLKGSDNSLISEKIDNNIGMLDARLIFDCAKEGDLIAERAVDRLVKYLAIGMGNIINILDPEIIIIGGGISGAGDYLIEKLNREVPENIWLKSMNLTKIVAASLGNDAGIIGSALHAKSKSDL